MEDFLRMLPENFVEMSEPDSVKTIVDMLKAGKKVQIEDNARRAELSDIEKERAELVAKYDKEKAAALDAFDVEHDSVVRG